MSFIPSFLKSAPQVVVANFTAADLFIDVVLGTAVDINNAIAMFNGCNGSDSSGFSTGAVECAVIVLNTNTVRFYRNTCNSGAQGNTLTAYATVLEFQPAFLRQAVAFFASKSVTFAHGLTLGAKAFLVYCGANSALGDSAAVGFSFDLFVAAKINGANIDILESASSGFGGDISFYIVDPK